MLRDLVRILLMVVWLLIGVGVVIDAVHGEYARATFFLLVAWVTKDLFLRPRTGVDHE